ncbi:hypothetical protein HN385_01230 [archaeon]|jgi:pyruvate/2-oxoglutarate/acetoin dehydrogenase E1 component|nr:hypothetical protein [archaeon]MBT3451367.1 hypothetical protein [archaeon]MBT6869317.1 hypothetical protein [archaeon]MBT7192480.1 hypothetical protein [archaeon]MBT7380556.1 hypothetical protein [archaeon]
MKYITYVNQLIKELVAEPEEIVIFGQNVSAGSCISGLTRGLTVKKDGLILNTSNSENSLCGIGFGLMLSKVPSIFFMKQQDFLLLGIDHLVNTYNFIRTKKPESSFTIFTPIIDNGYQGLQSSLNNFSDFCSIARIPGYAITNKVDAEKILKEHLISPGFRIIGISQRLCSEEILCPSLVNTDEKGNIFKYYSGNDATIVCFNFSFPQGLELYNKLKQENINASLFSVSSIINGDWSKIISDTSITKNMIILDDSKSINLSCNSLIKDVLEVTTLKSNILLSRDLSGDWLSPNEDKLVIDHNQIIEKIKKNNLI